MSESGLKERARELIRAYAPRLFIVVIIYVLISTVLSELSFRLLNFDVSLTEINERLGSGEPFGFNTLFPNFNSAGAAFATLLILFSPIISVGFMGYCLKISRDTDADYRSLFDGFVYFPKILLIFIITRVLVLLWSLLFILPGIAASYAYSQAYYILLDSPEKSALQCIRESRKLMAGKKLDLFFLDLSFIGWYFLNSIVSIWLSFPLPVISVLLEPYFGISRAGFYNKLIKYVPPPPVV